jgi:hypothetical protein
MTLAPTSGDQPGPCGPGTGRASAAALAAVLLADSFAGLPPGGTRWRLAAALRAAARPLGLSAGMLALLEHYIDATYDSDWLPGSEPVVFRPLVGVAEHFGKSERQIRNIEAALVARGLLAWRDSGNRQRRGRRDRRGRLVYGYGPTLAPLGVRYAEIVALAETTRREAADNQRTRLAIGALRRRIRTELERRGADGSHPAAARLAATPRRLPAGMDGDRLRATADALRATLAQLGAAGGDASDAVATSGEAEISGRPSTGTTTEKSMNGRLPTEGPEVDFASLWRMAGPQFREAFERRSTGARDRMREGGAATAAACGVAGEAWEHACARIGPARAAICALTLERALGRGGNGGVRRADAYFRALVARAERGALRIPMRGDRHRGRAPAGGAGGTADDRPWAGR